VVNSRVTAEDPISFKDFTRGGWHRQFPLQTIRHVGIKKASKSISAELCLICTGRAIYH
jgi:hypothetical protein